MLTVQNMPVAINIKELTGLPQSWDEFGHPQLSIKELTGLSQSWDEYRYPQLSIKELTGLHKAGMNIATLSYLWRN